MYSPISFFVQFRNKKHFEVTLLKIHLILKKLCKTHFNPIQSISNFTQNVTSISFIRHIPTSYSVLTFRALLTGIYAGLVQAQNVIRGFPFFYIYRLIVVLVCEGLKIWM